MEATIPRCLAWPLETPNSHFSGLFFKIMTYTTCGDKEGQETDKRGKSPD